jgi:hypothetical protein
MKNRLDYSDLAQIKNGKQIEKEHRQSVIEEDIKLIDSALESGNENYVKEVHQKIDGRYQSCIQKWGFGMYGFHPEYGFDYHRLTTIFMKDNLKVMRPKLEAYKDGWNEIMAGNSKENMGVNVTVNNNNSINIELSFEQARQKIEDMPGLTQADTEEIQNKIYELENISNEEISKKKKWEKVKPIISYSLDKGADVAITIMGLILQMKLGM